MDRSLGTAGAATDAAASRIFGVVAATTAVGLLASLVGPTVPVEPVRFLIVVAAFVVAGAGTIRLDIGQQRCTMTAAPLVLAAAVGSLPAIAMGVASAIGEATTLLPLRIGRRKMVVNLVSRWTAAVIGTATFTILEPLGTSVTVTALRSCAAVLAYSASSSVAVAAAMAAAKVRSFAEVLRQTGSASGIVAVGTASLGGSARALAATSPLAPALLAPMLFVIWRASRAAVAQRDQHRRLVELYGAVAETVPLAEISSVLQTIGSQARSLVAADVALAAMVWPGAVPTGGVVSGAGGRAVSAHVAEAAFALALGDKPRRVTAEHLPPALRETLGHRDVLVAGRRGPDGSSVCVVTALAAGHDSAVEHKVETLATYASHVALIASNFRLYAEVQNALRHQLDLNKRKDEFVATLSHELRTPLTVTIGALEALGRYQGRMTPELQQDLLADASAHADRLRLLIDDLLTVASGPSRVVLDAVGLDELLTSVRLSVLPAISDRTRLVFPDRLHEPICTHLPSVERIVGNLLSNAAKYGGHGPIEVILAAQASNLELLVVDHGPGIPADEVDRAFDRFVQLDQSDTRREGGVGLGLYLCRRLADAIGATLTLRPTPGGGATFSLALPLDARGEAGPRALSPSRVAAGAPTADDVAAAFGWEQELATSTAGA